MNGSLKLSLAVALALGSANALALGLGSIQVKSGLNEPLIAEIPVTGGPDETAGVSVALAAASDFERVGLSRSRILVPLEFQVAIGAKGNAVIKVTSKEPVRDPFLDFLIEVNWAKGKLLREYTVLLDPPTMAPAVKGSHASTAPVRETAGAASSQPLPAGKQPKPGKKPAVAASETPATPTAEPKPTKPASAPRAGDYGPVSSGETLWEVASATKPDDGTNLNQMMVALLRSNPAAFYKDNINSLKRGAILRVPSADEIKAVGNAAAAAAEVRNQTEAWRSGNTNAAPTLVADTGTAPRTASTTSSKPKPSDRLELVPPKASKDNAHAGAEKAGSGTSGAGDVTTRAELARTKEALASREQESSELKSRVKELEDLKSKNDKLISFKDSELAELQKKLKELQDKASKAPATSTTTVIATPPPSSTTTTVTAPKPLDSKNAGVTKEDVWGSASGETPKPSTSTTTTPAPTSATTTGTPPTSTSPTTSSTAANPLTVSPTPTTSPTTTPTATTATSAVTPSPSSSTTPTTTVSPNPATSATTPIDSATAPVTPATTPPKPVVSTAVPIKPTPATQTQPLSVSEPWYRKTWVLGLGGLALLGVVILALVNLMRRPKAVALPGGATMLDDAHAEEQMLLERLAQYPDDTSAHLELASLYYAQQDVDKFEAAAQAMYAHISDTASPEWEQVRGMGSELAPHNPLFEDGATGHGHHDHGGYSTQPEPMRFDNFEDAHSLASTAPDTSHSDDGGSFDFDLTDRSAAQTVPPPSARPPAAPARDQFAMDLPPASSFDTRISMPELQRPPDLAVPRMDDELIAVDDAIGTKLDLAKAYLDMGDPDGARSMLEEVLGEGSDSQRNEARRLLAEIR
ncbi:MAG: FimV/HubP family polar landmark protein [Tahibacter sp.]